MTTIAPAPPTAAPVKEPVRTFSELSRPGSPVHPGFVVGAPAYPAFRSETGLSERLAAVRLIPDLGEHHV